MSKLNLSQKNFYNKNKNIKENLKEKKRPPTSTNNMNYNFKNELGLFSNGNNNDIINNNNINNNINNRKKKKK